MNNIKDYRKEELRAYVISNILVALYLSGFLTESTIKDETFITLIGSTLISSIAYIYVYILDTVIPAEWKDKLVYLFTGRPGDTVFSMIKEKDNDSRFTKEEAEQKYADIYERIDNVSSIEEKHKVENSSWYKIYREHRDEGSVFNSQRDFLLNRDMSFMTIDLLIIYTVLAWFINEVEFSWKFFVLLVIEFLFTNIAARGRAKKFVMNVIAVDVHN